MAYVRKTRDEWTVQGNYGCGWEIVTYEENKHDAYQTLRDYDENEIGVPHRVKKIRVRKEC